MLNRRNLLIALSSAVALSLFVGSVEAERPKPLIKTRLFYPDAPQMLLWDAMDDETVSVQVVAMDDHEGALIVHNNTNAPITIQFPEAIVGVQVLPQFGNIGGNNNNGGLNGQNGQNGFGGQNQQFGGGQNGQNGQNGFGNNGGNNNGFFSIPAERTVRVPYQSVCLNHGRPNPNPRITYKIIRPEEYTEDKNLIELLKMIGTGTINTDVAQAATWHLTDNMSWNELANKKYNNVGRPDTPYFHQDTLAAAQQLIGIAQQRARERAKEEAKKPATAPKSLPQSGSVNP
ncbi:MAG: hypothetical protein R3C01_12910 [Planctomycetaceae bacterium]